MADPISNIIWTWLVRIFIALGGFAGVTRIMEWIFRRPKIVGEIEQMFTASEVVETKDGKQTLLGAIALMQLYLVNTRVRPVSVKAYKMQAESGHQSETGTPILIPVGFRLPQVPGVDFSKARLYDITAANVLEFGKGVRGWIRFRFVTLTNEQLRTAKYTIEVIDALDRKHKISHRAGKAVTHEVSYYPGTGMEH